MSLKTRNQCNQSSADVRLGGSFIRVEEWSVLGAGIATGKIFGGTQETLDEERGKKEEEKRKKKNPNKYLNLPIGQVFLE